MMDLDREIEEIRAEAKRQVAESLNTGYGEGIAYGRSSMACKALLVIEELKKEFKTSLEIQKKLMDIINKARIEIREENDCSVATFRHREIKKTWVIPADVNPKHVEFARRFL